MKRAAVVLGMCGVLLSAAATTAMAEAPRYYGDVMRWYESAAKAGDAEAQFLLGLQYEEGVRAKIRTGTDTPEMKAAVAWYAKAAAQGHRQAQMRLAGILFEGRGVARDFAAAARWFEAAAGKGSGPAAYNLGLMHRRGFGVAADAATAALWYTKAFALGVGRAALDLAVLYAIGEGVERDPVEALSWLIAAERMGVAVGDDVRAAVTADLDIAEKAEAERRAASRNTAK